MDRVVYTGRRLQLGAGPPLILVFLALSLTEVAPSFAVFKGWGPVLPAPRNLGTELSSSPPAALR